MAVQPIHTVIPHPIGGGGQRKSILLHEGAPVGELATIFKEKRHEKPYQSQNPKHMIVDAQFGKEVQRVAYKPLSESAISEITKALQNKQKK